MDETTGSTSGSDESSSDELKGKAQDVGRQAKSKAQGVAQKLKSQGKQQLESGKDTAASTVEQVADAVSRASDELHQQEQHGLADYASQVAGSITSFADTLRNRSVDELIAETQTLARRNPTVFFLGSIGVGLALSRFLKASARNTTAQFGDEQGLDVSYAAGSEWQQPDASQAVYGGQPTAVSGSPARPESGGSRERQSTPTPPPSGPYP